MRPFLHFSKPIAPAYSHEINTVRVVIHDLVFARNKVHVWEKMWSNFTCPSCNIWAASRCERWPRWSQQIQLYLIRPTYLLNEGASGFLAYSCTLPVDLFQEGIDHQLSMWWDCPSTSPDLTGHDLWQVNSLFSYSPQTVYRNTTCNQRDYPTCPFSH